GRSLQFMEQIRNLCQSSGFAKLSKATEGIQPLTEIQEKIRTTLVEEPPVQVNKGNIIRQGVHTELDELRLISRSGKDYLLQIQQLEAQATGISSLKIAYNNVFGYYLEVTHAHKDKVPASWIRKQTLTNAERYVTPE